jgi:succinate-acetate transporter protein
MHIWAALSYALLFALLSIAPWTVKAGITTAAGLLLFITSILGQFAVAASIYVARLRVKEILSHAVTP